MQIMLLSRFWLVTIVGMLNENGGVTHYVSREKEEKTMIKCSRVGIAIVLCLLLCLFLLITGMVAHQASHRFPGRTVSVATAVELCPPGTREIVVNPIDGFDGVRICY